MEYTRKTARRQPGASHLLQMSVEPGVEAAFGDQLLVIAVFGDMPAIEDQDPVGLLHRRQPMGHDQCGAAFEEVPERLCRAYSVAASRAEVASSRITTLGSARIIRAIARRCR